jgi:hypothetical protein
MRRRALPDAREASDILIARPYQSVCVYHKLVCAPRGRQHKTLWRTAVKVAMSPTLHGTLEEGKEDKCV